MPETVPDARMPWTMATIARLVAQEFDVTVTDIRSHRRTRTVTLPRQVAYYLMREMLPRSYPEIGRFIGDRDHTSVMHGCQVVEKRMKEDTAFAARVEAIRDRLRVLYRDPGAEAVAIAGKIERHPGASKAVLSEEVLILSEHVMRGNREVAIERARLRSMQEHLGAALATAEEMAMDEQKTARLRSQDSHVRKFRVVPAHIIDRDLAR